MRNFLGLWLVLVVGSALGIVLSCCDLAWRAGKRARAQHESFFSRYWAELRFVFRFEQSTKPLQVPIKCPNSYFTSLEVTFPSPHYGIIVNIVTDRVIR